MIGIRQGSGFREPQFGNQTANRTSSSPRALSATARKDATGIQNQSRNPFEGGNGSTTDALVHLLQQLIALISGDKGTGNTQGHGNANTGLLTTPTFATGNGQQAQAATAQPQVLSTAETESLRFMREEEKLARDAYTSLYQQWQLPIFNNISQSEQQHTDRVETLLQTYRIADPVTNDAVGVFQNTELADLYATLMERGQTSALDALHVGALIEEVDIVDLQKSMRETTRPDILNTYDNLLRASRNHLRAFVEQIQSQGVTYQAQTMPQAEVDAIVNSPNERGQGGGRQGGGRGQGRGQGRGM